MTPRLSVLMPTYRQAHFLPRALDSLLGQTLTDWECIVVDDGSPDETRAIVERYLSDSRIQYVRLNENCGLGAALNCGLERAKTPFVAYLPSDDVIYTDHLATLCETLEAHEGVILAYSGVRHHYNRVATGQIPGYPLQLVQVMHRRTADRWLERAELVTDDLERMYWSVLRSCGNCIGTGHVTCEWVDHPQQRHKLLREPLGGINTYRSYYAVKQPLRFHSSVGNRSDEVAHYRRFRERPATPPAAAGLKILLVGELAYNPERVLALEERGHRLYGLWMTDPYWYNTVGPLPFGHVTDIPREQWRAAVRAIQPDIIYALLNWQAVPFAHSVLMENLRSLGIPFVWHFKEGPFICLEKGYWSQLVDLYTRSDGQIYISPEMREWCATAIPATIDSACSLVLDGDLPKRDWFGDDRSPLLSAIDSEYREYHTVVPGRPIGLHPEIVGELAQQRIHLHFYGDFTHGQWVDWVERARQLAPDYLHLHANIDQEQWVAEFSQYDAGWLHFMKSENGGDPRRANWDDLNYPARIATLAAAGLPMLQYDNRDAAVATQSLTRAYDMGLFFTSMEQLRAQLDDTARVAQLREHVWHHRETFTFDYHADRLITFFRQAIASKSSRHG